ncbi:MAG: hypothetical protein ACT4N2_00620 [Hyphomicrobium sp.]
MCDYSLEMYQTRPARAGERYQTHRFPTGSIGFIAPGAPEIAVCLACDTELVLDHLPTSVQRGCGVPEQCTAMFVRLDQGPHHDGLRFANGAELPLQLLGPGVAAYMADAVVPRVAAVPLSIRKLADVT